MARQRDRLIPDSSAACCDQHDHSGHCKQCRRHHSLPCSAEALVAARELMEKLACHRRLDFDRPLAAADPGLGTELLFGPARGKMFGVLVCRTDQGAQKVLRAWSGQYNGHWLVPGWAPPLFDPAAFEAINQVEEPKIKAMGRRLDALAPEDPERALLKQERRRRCRQLMSHLHGLYLLHNFQGQQASLGQAWQGPGGIPTGSGDCCGPKLLNQAARLGLTPTGMAEFYWGRANPSASRSQGYFYPACTDKCGPILGFLLCGLKELP